MWNTHVRTSLCRSLQDEFFWICIISDYSLLSGTFQVKLNIYLYWMLTENKKAFLASGNRYYRTLGPYILELLVRLMVIETLIGSIIKSSKLWEACATVAPLTHTHKDNEIFTAAVGKVNKKCLQETSNDNNSLVMNPQQIKPMWRLVVTLYQPIHPSEQPSHEHTVS